MLDPATLLHTIGYFGIAAILFAETGLLIGFFLPGDSLLITAGLLAASGDLNLAGVVIAGLIGAVLGDSVGYAIGHRFGPAVFSRPGSRLFRPEYRERAEQFFLRYGPRAVVLARFVPIVRTAVPTLAGAGRMPYASFLIYNLVGALLWAAGVPLAGYFLGQLIPNLDHYILLIVGVVLVVSVIPVLLEVRRARRDAHQEPPTP